MDPSTRFVVLFNTPCPYRDACPYGKHCSLRGFEVLECDMYWQLDREEKERMRKMIRRYLKKRSGGG